MTSLKHTPNSVDWPSPSRGWYVVGVLFIAYTFSFIDRQIIVLMVGPIKQDLGLSDTQISLLHGMAFAVFYTLFGLPLGRLMDLYNRRRLITVGVTLWSLMTAACGLMNSFLGLFGCRIGVGVGEAALSPGAYSLIADYFPREKRGRALSVYSLGITVGVGLAFIFGGIVIDVVSVQDTLTFPLLGDIAPWQAAFIVVGLPGLLAAALVMTIREPLRREQMLKADGNHHVTVSEVFLFIRERWLAFGTLFVGLGLLSMASYALMAWFPTMFIRRFAWTPGEIGIAYGLIMAIAGSIGVFAGGAFSDYLTRRGSKNAAMQTILLSSIFTLGFGVAAPILPTPQLCLAALAAASFFIVAPYGLAPVAIQAMTPNQMRGLISALYLFTINIFGLGLGSTSVALITDFIFADEAKVGWSIAVAIGVEVPLAILVIAIGMKAYRACSYESASQ